MNIAIVTPSQNLYSETFIQAQKNELQGNIFYYYGGIPPLKLENKASLKGNIIKEVYWKILSIYRRNNLIPCKKRFLNSLKKENIDIVLAQYGTTGAELVPYCEKLNLPLIIHFHGYDASQHDVISNYKEKYLKAFQYAKYIIAVSQKMKRNLEKLGVPKEKLILNTYGPNKIFSTVKPTLEDKKLISVGRFVNKKAPYYTILAFKKALKKHPDAKLIMGGSGPLLETCKNLVSLNKLNNAVIFKGIITPKQFTEELKTARAYVQHSITAENGDMEGTPLSILEASSAGLPVISTIHAGIPDVIIDKKNGLLINEHDVDEMSEAMIRILDSKEYAQTLGSNGKEYINENFNLDIYINNLNKLLEKSI